MRARCAAARRDTETATASAARSRSAPTSRLWQARRERGRTLRPPRRRPAATLQCCSRTGSSPQRAGRQAPPQRPPCPLRSRRPSLTSRPLHCRPPGQPAGRRAATGSAAAAAPVRGQQQPADGRGAAALAEMDRCPSAGCSPWKRCRAQRGSLCSRTSPPALLCETGGGFSMPLGSACLGSAVPPLHCESSLRSRG
jgi:hypothetical protein